MHLLVGDADFNVNTICLAVDTDLLSRARTRYDASAVKKAPATASQPGEWFCFVCLCKHCCRVHFQCGFFTGKFVAPMKDNASLNLAPKGKGKGKGKGKPSKTSWGSDNWNKSWGKQNKW